MSPTVGTSARVGTLAKVGMPTTEQYEVEVAQVEKLAQKCLRTQPCFRETTGLEKNCVF
jgi:hypothetical protein